MEITMTVLYLILLLLAAVCFLASASGRNYGRGGATVNLVALGLLFWVLVPFIQTVRAL